MTRIGSLRHGDIHKTAARVVVAIRLGSLLIGAPMALLAAIPPVSTPILITAMIAFSGWTAFFTRIALTQGLTNPLMIGDVCACALLCLCGGWLVPLGTVDDGSSWVATLASLCLVSLPLAWRLSAAIPAGLIVIAAYILGFVLAGHTGAAEWHAVTMALQLLCAAAAVTVAHRASRVAHRACEAAPRTSAETPHAGSPAIVDHARGHARRPDEGMQLRLLHDTVLTTLTMVGTGMVTRSAAVAEHANNGLAVIDRLSHQAQPDPHLEVPLREAVLETIRHGPAELVVESTSQPVRVPAQVADAFAGGLGEALRNVSRHAGATLVEVFVTEADDRVQMEITDAGCGFDPATVPPHRHGLRQSIVERMRSVGGTARVRSTPGVGTTWVLEWHQRGER